MNVTVDPDLDCSGGNPVLKDSDKCVQDIIMNYDLVDIWRIRNPKLIRTNAEETTVPGTTMNQIHTFIWNFMTKRREYKLTLQLVLFWKIPFHLLS